MVFEREWKGTRSRLEPVHLFPGFSYLTFILESVFCVVFTALVIIHPL